MSEVKCCPFCGSKPYVRKVRVKYVDADSADRWKVMCGGRVDCCALLNDFASEEEAIAAWNRRAGNG